MGAFYRVRYLIFSWRLPPVSLCKHSNPFSALHQPHSSATPARQIHRHHQVALLKARGKSVSWPYLFLIVISTVTLTQAICEAADKPAHTHICFAEIPQIRVSIHIHYDSPIPTHSRRQTPLSSLSHQEMDTYPSLTRPTGSTCCCISGPL